MLSINGELRTSATTTGILVFVRRPARALSQSRRASVRLQVDSAALTSGAIGSEFLFNSIDGSAAGDTIDLGGAGYDWNGSAALESGNVLQIAKGGHTQQACKPLK
jgi:hypothetical protein